MNIRTSADLYKVYMSYQPPNNAINQTQGHNPQEIVGMMNRHNNLVAKNKKALQ